MIMNKMVMIFKLIKSSVIYKYLNFRYSKIDYFEYKRLCSIYYDVIKFRFMGMSLLYGNHLALQKYLKRKMNFRYECLEHAIFWENNLFISPYPKMKRLYTFSEYRKKLLLESAYKINFNLDIVAVGPYIQYVDYFYPKGKLDRIKQRYGKILLVFPSHSLELVNKGFNVTDFIGEIKRAGEQFDSIFICMYWKDVMDGKEKSYVDAGFTIVSNGHRSDPKFMSRQKDLLYLAAMTMSNDLGTYIGYSIVMNKPHYFYKQDVSIDTQNDFLRSVITTSEALSEEVASLFGTLSFDISLEQKKFVEKWWGKWH